MNYCIILNWNGSGDTIECIKSILDNFDIDFKVIICDNFSTDDSFSKIEKFLSVELSENRKLTLQIYRDQPHPSAVHLPLSDFTLVQTGENKGYAAGNNFGIKLALLDRDCVGVWLLNNDTRVHNYALKYLVEEAAENNNDTLVGSTLLNENTKNEVQMAGGTLTKWLGIPLKNFKNEKLDDLPSRMHVDYVSGASMYIPIKVLSRVGLLPERYFMYWEETDYCHRVYDVTKVKPICISKSIITHKEGAKVGRRSVFQLRLDSINTIRFYKKYYPSYLPVVFFTKYFVNLLSIAENKEFKFKYLLLFLRWQLLGLNIKDSEITPVN